MESGWPIPPAAPRIATFAPYTSKKKHDPTEVNDRDKDFEALGNTLANIEQKECAKQIPRSVGAS